MHEILQNSAAALQERFGATLQEFRGEVTLLIAPEKIVQALQVLRDEFDFKMLIDATAVDYHPAQEPRFHVVYHLTSIQHNQVIGVRVPLNGNAPHLATAEMVFPNANWHERELFDMFGILFDGHSDMRRIIMPYDWEGHPLRKDYPLGYEEVQFTFNLDEIDLRKPHGSL